MAVVAVAALAACGTVPVTPPPTEFPLFQRIDARVGTAYRSAARLAYVSIPLLRIDVGQASTARFQKAFGAMFTETIELPDWPPWRHEMPKVDAVIELQSVDVELLLGDDMKRPDVASVAYRVCLYAAPGEEIRCWTPSARNTHQRRIGECLDLRDCVVLQVEVAMREAVALFLVEAENEPALRQWAARLVEGRRRP